MKRAVNQQLWDTWRQRLQQQADSGLTIAAFCDQHHIRPGSFYQWKRKLNSQPSAPQAPAVSAATRPTPLPGTHEAPFLQLAAAPSATSSQWIELLLPSGAIVRLPAQNLAALEAVLRSLALSA
jgi:transposase-like protein